jgi:hypothetical protein
MVKTSISRLPADLPCSIGQQSIIDLAAPGLENKAHDCTRPMNGAASKSDILESNWLMVQLRYRQGFDLEILVLAVRHNRA